MYGYTRNFCYHPPNFVKRGWNHFANYCTKTREEFAKVQIVAETTQQPLKVVKLSMTYKTKLMIKTEKIKNNKSIKKQPILTSSVPPAPQINNALIINSNLKINVCKSHSQHFTSRSTFSRHT